MRATVVLVVWVAAMSAGCGAETCSPNQKPLNLPLAPIAQLCVQTVVGVAIDCTVVRASNMTMAWEELGEESLACVDIRERAGFWIFVMEVPQRSRQHLSLIHISEPTRPY
eukprot:TRINITY_DN5806_c0_g1_i1.p1 TRINITY_DN5806_c0_g1~~TRINITY_DN5806_c0_g1_i1.p1  ORF type:complete len:111 (-),score=9.73 TRINITY_DN5806_c0_g1_i1:52-384(-)